MRRDDLPSPEARQALPLDTRFGGRVVQVSEALVGADGTSAQILELHRQLQEMGLDSVVHTQWFDPELGDRRHPLETLCADEHDILLVHMDDLSGYVLPAVLAMHTTRVLVYHGIPPEAHFAPDSAMARRMRAGREQLASAAGIFHRFWVPDDARAAELQALGVARELCDIVPAIVRPGPLAGVDGARCPGTWLCAARTWAHKRIPELMQLFAQQRESHPELARELWLVGRRHADDDRDPGVDTDTGVLAWGQVDVVRFETLLSQAGIFVSCSAYERQGRAMIEAVHAGLPVVGLNCAGIRTAIGTADAIVDRIEDLAPLVASLMSDPARRQALCARQRQHVRRFEPAAAAVPLARALGALLPSAGRFHGVSVVVCTYNRAELLDRCLDYLQHQTDPRFEVIVVNGPSTDDTQAVLAAYADRIKVVVNPVTNLSVSRNLGVAAASGQLIAYIDDDALPFDDWVGCLLDEFGRRPLTTAALGGPVYYAGSMEFQAQDIGINGRAEVCTDISQDQIGRNGWARSLLGTNVCFRADVLRTTRGFDEQFDYFLDESELTYRLQREGWLVGYCPELYLRHEFAQSSNRSGQHRFNWFSICKNTAYFVARYSGLDGAALTDYLRTRIEAERIAPLDAAAKAGELSEADRDALVQRIHAGVEQGLRDAELPPERALLPQASARMRPFTMPGADASTGLKPTRLHICFITQEFPPFGNAGGIGTMYYHLASELLLMGHHVTVITPGAESHASRRGRFQLRFVVARRGSPGQAEPSAFNANLTWSLCALNEAAVVHAEQAVDVFDSALWNAEALALSLLPRRPPLVLRLVTPIITVAQQNGWSIPALELERLQQAELQLIARADAVVALSASIGRMIERTHGLTPDRRWHLSPCGIAYWPSFEYSDDYTDLRRIDGRTWALPEGARFALFVGRLERRKGIDLLLEAARRVLAEDPELWLVIAGRDIAGWTEQIDNLVGSALAERIVLLGEVSVAAREKLLNGARCLVFPSRYESFGLVPLEAFVHGLPTVAARAGAVPEVIVDGESGLLFEPDDPAGLADAVLRLSRDDALHQRLAAGSRRRSRDFSSRRSASRAVNLYRQLVMARRST